MQAAGSEVESMKKLVRPSVFAVVAGLVGFGCGDDSAGSGGSGGGTTGTTSTSVAAGSPTATTGTGPGSGDASSTGDTTSGPGGHGGAGTSSASDGGAGPGTGTGGTGSSSSSDGGAGPGAGTGGAGGDGTGGDGTGGDGTGGEATSGPTSGTGGASTCEPLSNTNCARCPDVIGQPECTTDDLCDGNFGADYGELLACACGDDAPCGAVCAADLCAGGDISGDCDVCVHAACPEQMVECLNNGPPEDNCGLDCNGLLNDAIVVEDGCQAQGALLMYDLLDCACDPDVGACIDECELSLCADNVPYGACRACLEAQCAEPFDACLEHI